MAAVQWRNSYFFSVLSRITAAAIGGYAFTTVGSICLSRILPMSPTDALMTAMLLSFCVYTASVLWVFAARTAGRAWLGLLSSTTLCGVLVLLLGNAGGS